MSYDYATMMVEGWEEVDIQICRCSGCGEEKMCKVMVKGNRRLAVCEDCFIDDTGRFEPLEKA